MKRSKIIFLLIGLILSATVSTTLSLYIRNNNISSNNEEITVLAIINYGSLKQDNQEEYNVSISKGSTALQVFIKIAELDLVNYSIGVYVRGVNGYTEQLPNKYWTFYYFNHETLTWIYSEVGVNSFFVDKEDQIKLQYSG